jgi:hypothetical protein
MITASEAIQLFRSKAAAGEVANLKSGGFLPIAERDVHSIISCVIAAFTYAAEGSDLTQISYTTYADDLSRYAVADAKERGIKDIAGRATRCRRFVATVDGRVRERRRPGRDAVPESWLPLYDAAVEAGLGRSYLSHITRLAGLLGPKGCRTPAEIPLRNTLFQLFVDTGVVPRGTMDPLLNTYRRVRLLMLERGFGTDLPDIDRCPITSERGLRGLPDIVERLEAKGYTGPVRALEVEQVVHLLAPRWHAVMQAYIERHETPSNRKSLRKKVVGASSRFLAALVQSGFGNLESAHPTSLFLRKVDTGETIDDEVIGGVEWQEEFLESLGLTADSEHGDAATRSVRLFELLAYEVAHESAENSPREAVELDGTRKRAEPAFWTNTVIQDVRIFGELALLGGRNSSIFRKAPGLQEEARAEWRGFLRVMKEANSGVRFAGVKAKTRALELLTFPMILCLGLPALVRRAARLRERWHAALLCHGHNPDHLSVQRAENKLDEAILDYLIVAIFSADGLRLANYANARLGELGRETMVENRTDAGEVVRSYCHIKPILGPDAERLIGVQTNFYGDDHAAVKLKIDKVPGSDEWREHPHWLRPGVVDREILWDMLIRIRPKRLAAQGLIPASAEYDIRRDIREQHFALFVSPKRSEDPYKAATGAYCDSAISDRYGRVLHWICTEVLSRDLPEYGPELKRRYPNVFSAHISRLIAGSYLFGVLDRKQEAATLLNDTVRMVERRYSVSEMSTVHKLGWEAPHFFDGYFKRIWDDGGVIDWDREDPLQGQEIARLCRLRLAA